MKSEKNKKRPTKSASARRVVGRRAGKAKRTVSAARLSAVKARKNTASTSDALEILDSDVGEDLQLRAEIERQVLSTKLAEFVYEQRRRARLTQKELAERIGTTQSVISRLEDADYDGHTLKTVQRIAIAVDAKLVLEINPAGKRAVTV